MSAVPVSVAFSTKVHLWWTWLRIAAEHAGRAKRARNGEADPASFEAHESAMLSEEFRNSIVSIAAVAFAMEALDKELTSNGFELDKSGIEIPPKTNAGFYVGNRLLQAFSFTGELAHTLPAKLESLFQLRNGSVHFESEHREGVHIHPNGNQTALELTIYVLEECLSALRLAVSIISECAASAAEGRAHESAKYIVAELPGVIKMFAEIVESQGLKDDCYANL